MWRRRAGLGALLIAGVALTVACSSGSKKSASSGSPAPPSIGDAAKLPGTAAGDNSAIALQVTRRAQYAWPALGDIVSYFGLYSPNGIEIALNPTGDSPVRASAAGVVTFAGGDPCCENGISVRIDHGDNTSTVYGHLSQIAVGQGDHVDQGDVLGMGGSTGAAGGKWLHFEVRQGEQAVDPLRYLGHEQSPYPTDVSSASCRTAVAVEPASVVTLKFVGPEVSGYQVSRVSAGTTGSAYFPAIKADKTDELEVTLVIPPAPSASGAPVDFAVKAGLTKNGGDEKSISCPLVLATLLTKANQPPAPAPPAAPVASIDGPPVDIGMPEIAPPQPPFILPTATRTPFKPTATATPKPTFTPTPRPGINTTAAPFGTTPKPGTPNPSGTASPSGTIPPPPFGTAAPSGTPVKTPTFSPPSVQ